MRRRSRLIGEFVLIVFGVLVAMTVDTWFDEWQDRSLRREYVAGLVADVQVDLQGLETRITFFSDVLLAAQQTLDWIESDRPPSVEILLGAYYSAEQYAFQPIRMTYNDLQNTGNITLLDDLDLRRQLGAYYSLALVREPGWTLPRSYREIARAAIAPRIQTQIREDCPAEVGGRTTGLPACELPGVNATEVAAALSRLRSNEATHGALSFLMSEMYVSIELFGQQAGDARALIERLAN